MNPFQEYWRNVRRFSPEARLFLLVSTLQGIGGGIFQLFFNFYIVSLGYHEDFLGVLIAIPSLVALVTALGAGYLSDTLGRKKAFLSGGITMVIAQVIMLILPTPFILILSRVLSGLGNSLFSIAASPFLMEHSTEEERTYLFSFNSGISTVSSFAGNFVGGVLPLFFARQMGISPTSSLAYAASMAVTSVLMAVSLLPLLKLTDRTHRHEKKAGSPFHGLWVQRSQMFRLLFPSLLVSLGAGLLIPFMNLFFRNRFGLDDTVIGPLIGFGSLGMGVAFLVAPVLAERWGKARAVVITQALSIPFMILLGFVPNLTVAFIAYFIRMALMNLSSPIYQTMVMEEVEDDARGMAASLYSMIWNFGRALSPIISGPIQMHYGFDPIFVATILTYGVSVWMLWVWFVRGRARQTLTVPALAEQ